MNVLVFKYRLLVYYDNIIYLGFNILRFLLGCTFSAMTYVPGCL